jgi:hypothetical protein
MRLTTRRKGALTRVSLVDMVMQLRHENSRLQYKVREAEAAAALARDSSNEWRDRYLSLRDSRAGESPRELRRVLDRTDV